MWHNSKVKLHASHLVLVVALQDFAEQRESRGEMPGILAPALCSLCQQAGSDRVNKTGSEARYESPLLPGSSLSLSLLSDRAFPS